LKLILTRHGETYWNEERRVQGGSSDIDLNDVGLKQARKLASFLKTKNIAAVVSSPLNRAVVTAEAIASHHQLPVEIDEGLKEIEVGEFEGLALSDLKTTFTEFLMQWWKGGGTKKLPGGESLIEMQERAWKVIERLLAKHKKETVVVVSHYFVTLAIIFKALDLPFNYFTKFKVDPGGVSILEFGQYGTRLIALNDTSYFDYEKG
jgi:probable phosphoglycerate mutase